MEINIGNNRFGNVGLETQGMSFDAPSKTKNFLAPTLAGVQTPTVDALQRSEPVADVPDAALGRDDALGKLVNAAFSLPPPPMPTFA